MITISMVSKKLIELIELDSLPIYGDHPLNTASLTGVLPNDRERMLAILDDTLNIWLEKSKFSFPNGVFAQGGNLMVAN